MMAIAVPPYLAIWRSFAVKFSHHALDFHQHKLTLTVESDAFSQLEKFTTALKQQGLMVQQNDASSQGDKVTATIAIHN